MEDDTIYFPQNEFEREMKRTKGIRFFREYRKKLEEDKKKEKEMMEKGEYITVKEV